MDIEKEKELSVRELFFYVLRHWVAIVVATVVGAILFTSLGFVQNRNVDTTNPFELTQEELDYVHLTSELYKDVAPIRSAYTSSYVASIDPTTAYVSSLKYYVSTDDLIDTELGSQIVDSLASAYSQIITNRDFAQKVNEAIPAIGVNEVSSLVQAWVTGSIVNVTIVAKTQEDNATILELANKTIDDNFEYISDSINNHTISLYSSTSYIGSETDVKYAKEAYNNYIANKIDNLKYMILNMNPKQLRQFEIDNSETVESMFNATYKDLGLANYANKAAALTVPSGEKISVKYLVIGAFLGFALVACIYVLLFICGSKMNSVDDAKCYKGVKLITLINKDNIDLKKMYRMQLGLDKDDKCSCEYASKMINIALSKSDAAEVTVFSSYYSKDELKAICSKFDSSKVKCSNNRIYTVEGLNELINSKNVIVVEQLGKTKRSSFDYEIKRINEVGVNNIGVVLCI